MRFRFSHVKFIDTHAHLHDQEFESDRSEVIERAQAAGIARIVLMGEEIENSRRALEMCSDGDLFYAAVGVHPHKASQWAPESAEVLRNELLANPRAVAVGEIGLDYHYDFAPRERQIEAFGVQLQIADDTGKPVVIHCREAYDELLDFVEDFQRGKTMRAQPFGIMHCFFGTLEQAQRSMDLDFMIGVGGGCTFKRAVELHEVVRQIPLERIVLETDAPYMAPVPHRGKRNESAYIPLIAGRVAELKNISVDEVARATTENAQRVFCIGAVEQ